MGSLVLTGDTSGSGTIAVPTVAGTFTATIGSATGTHYPFTAGTAVASTSGTSIDFTSIPSWVKRITVMFNGVSTNGTSNPQIQLGTGSTSYTSSGYQNQNFNITTSAAGTSTNSTTGFVFASGSASNTLTGQFILSNVTGNTWVGNGALFFSSTACGTSIGGIALAAALTAVRITTVNGTDTFDAGSINIFYE